MAAAVRRAIVYATEAGTSQEKAEAIHTRTGIDVVNITDFPLDSIDDYGFLIFVVPTYGGGEAPDSTSEIWAQLLARTKPLNGLQFAVWGLGSSDFGDTFVGFAKTLEAKLKELGAAEVTTLGITDSNETQSTNFDEWLPTLGIPLK
jgi:sulfite reductase (NADPH) flavoprotein alpha-component